MSVSSQTDKPSDDTDEQASPSQERRKSKDIPPVELHATLNMAQQVALSEVSHYGYDLRWIRNTPMGSLAIVMADGKVMTIDDDGEIEPNPKIVIRP